jgi:cob(I)alamin adenosyltransferase
MPRSANTSTQKSKLYTRSGDTGTTMLFGGGRMPKDHPRVEAYGTVDELNSTLGVALSFMPARGAIPKALGNVQNELFNIGSELASGTTGKAAEKARLFIDADAKIASLERLIDE